VKAIFLQMVLAIQEAITPAIRIWLYWIAIIFLSSVIFVWEYKSARIVLAAFFLTLPVAILVFRLSNSAHLIGIAHIAVWGPLAFYLIKSELMRSSFQYSAPYGVWIVLLLATIAVSLAFDVRDIVLVLLGRK
jgi:hypothetical protein